MNQLRVGNFTSSEIVALTTKDRSGKGFGKPAITYILETNMERRLGRSITDEVSARPLSWGKLNEKRVHDLLGIDYKLCSTETLSHPEIAYWKGSPDFIRYIADEEGFIQPSEQTVVDAKCPLTLKAFCQLVDGWNESGIDGIRAIPRDVGEKYYFQLVSNAILTGCRYAELIVYCPYLRELDAIREMAMQWDGPDQHQYKWIAYAQDEELPHLIEGGYYKNLNIFRFEVPFLDKQLLRDCVLEAGQHLVEIPKLELVEH